MAMALAMSNCVLMAMVTSVASKLPVIIRTGFRLASYLNPTQGIINVLANLTTTIALTLSVTTPTTVPKPMTTIMAMGVAVAMTMTMVLLLSVLALYAYACDYVGDVCDVGVVALCWRCC